MLKDSSNRICFICLEEDSLDDNSLIEYNHCGIYYIHNDCLNNWDPNDCLICRKKIIPEETERNGAEGNRAEEEETEGNRAERAERAERAAREETERNRAERAEENGTEGNESNNSDTLIEVRPVPNNNNRNLVVKTLISLVLIVDASIVMYYIIKI